MLVQEVYQVILNNQKPRPGHFLQSQLVSTTDFDNRKPTIKVQVAIRQG